MEKWRNTTTFVGEENRYSDLSIVLLENNASVNEKVGNGSAEQSF